MYNNNKLILYLPKFLRKSRIIQDITKTYNLEIEYIEASVEDVYNQMDIDKCTWFLPFLELEYGISIDTSKTLEERRSGLKAKMRGTGIVNLELLQMVANSWKNGEVNVEFTKEGLIKITFNSEFGVPTQLDGLKKAIDEVKPAHLGVYYEFLYILVKNVQSMTLNELQEKKISMFAFKTEQRR